MNENINVSEEIEFNNRIIETNNKAPNIFSRISFIISVILFSFMNPLVIVLKQIVIHAIYLSIQYKGYLTVILLQIIYVLIGILFFLGLMGICYRLVKLIKKSISFNEFAKPFLVSQLAFIILALFDFTMLPGMNNIGSESDQGTVIILFAGILGPILMLASILIFFIMLSKQSNKK